MTSCQARSSGLSTISRSDMRNVPDLGDEDLRVHGGFRLKAVANGQHRRCCGHSLHVHRCRDVAFRPRSARSGRYAIVATRGVVRAIPSAEARVYAGRGMIAGTRWRDDRHRVDESARVRASPAASSALGQILAVSQRRQIRRFGSPSIFRIVRAARGWPSPACWPVTVPLKRIRWAGQGLLRPCIRQFGGFTHRPPPRASIAYRLAYHYATGLSVNRIRKLCRMPRGYSWRVHHVYQALISMFDRSG